MAYQATVAAGHTAGRNVIVNALHSIFAGLIHIAEANPRLARIEKLQALSDEQLAARGLKREDIVRHVYRDMFYV